jgi:hypothetical protein
MDVACEIVVIDQGPAPGPEKLPKHVKYGFLDGAALAPGWRKAWGYNVGAGLASAGILVFHDGDICVPEQYARELLRSFGSSDTGAASLQRFLFYLDREASERCQFGDSLPEGLAPALVRQNWKGGTIALRRDAFARIGGFDEGFVGWGGEDDEFFDRCALVGHQRSGYLPFLHLWHPPQAESRSAMNVNTSQVLPRRLAIPSGARANELRARRAGSAEGPDPARSYAQGREG